MIDIMAKMLDIIILYNGVRTIILVAEEGSRRNGHVTGRVAMARRRIPHTEFTDTVQVLSGGWRMRWGSFLEKKWIH